MTSLPPVQSADTASHTIPQPKASELQSRPILLQDSIPIQSLPPAAQETPTSVPSITTPATTMPQAPPPAVIAGPTGLYGQQHVRNVSSSAIGPSSDDPLTPPSEPQSGPAVLITLLLITGARHPYTIDQKYLKRRNVVAATENVDPFSISVYTMKELIWRDWREGTFDMSVAGL